MDALQAMLDSEVPATHAWCYRHNCFCTIPLTDPSRTFHAAGTTCVDWSTLSRRPMRGLGQHMLPFMCWGKARARHRERLVLHECVIGHPSERMLRLFLAHSHIIISFKVCPSMIGYPCNRQRRFAVCIEKSSLVMRITAPPSQKFRFKVVCDGSIYWMAQPFEIDIFLAARGASSFRALLAPGSLERSCLHM